MTLLDKDLIGIIAAACFLFVFIVIGTICLAYRCQRRMENKKRVQILKNAIKDSLRRSRDKFTVNTRSGISISEVSSDSPAKMGGYRPKILAIDEESQNGGISRDSWRERDYKKWKYEKNKGTLEINERLRQKPVANGKAVSVVYVNGKVAQNGLDRESQSKKQVFEGFVTFPHVSNASQRSSGEIVLGHVVRQNSDFFNKGYSATGGGELIHGHHITATGGELVRGHIIKQNVTMGEDGKLAVTSSEQKDLGEVVRGHMSRQHHEITSTTVVTPGGGEIVRGHIIKQTVEMGEDGNLAVTSSEQRELGSSHGIYSITSPQIVHGRRETDTGHSSTFSGQYSEGSHTTHAQTDLDTRHTSYNVSESSGPQIVHGHYSSGKEDSFHVTREERRDVHGLLIAKERVGDDWFNPDGDAEEAVEDDDAVPDIVVTSEEAERSTDDMVVARRHESISEFYNDRSNLKVIKKHSAHKPPDWLVQTYADEAASADAPRERSDSATQVDAAALETEEIYRRRATHKVTFNEVSTEIQDAEIVGGYGSDSDHDDDDDGDDGEVGRSSGEIVRTTSQGDADYPDGGHGTYTITDYVDPLRRGRISTHTYQKTEQSDTGGISSTRVTTTSMTATSMRKIRQEVNESAEKIPPVFTSTPRAPWETQQSETTFMVSGSGASAFDIDHRRQRGPDTGALDMPPIVDIVE